MNQDLYNIVFYIFAFITVGAAVIVVLSRNIVRSAFALLFAFIGVAGLYIFLFADFIAVTQLLVYVGGILVLILFGVMLTNKQVKVDIKSGVMKFIPAVLLVTAIAGTLLTVFWSTGWTVVPQPVSPEKTAEDIGTMLLTRYLLPFEAASVLLLAALIGAAMIARRDKK